MHIDASGVEHQEKIKENFESIEGITIDSIVDGVEEIHKGGKIDVISRTELKDGDDLAMAYTPGVGRICTMIEQEPERVWELTGRRNAVAVLSNGTAVLGLGDIGPQAAMPVMEGNSRRTSCYSKSTRANIWWYKFRRCCCTDLFRS